MVTATESWIVEPTSNKARENSQNKYAFEASAGRGGMLEGGMLVDALDVGSESCALRSKTGYSLEHLQ